MISSPQSGERQQRCLRPERATDRCHPLRGESGQAGKFGLLPVAPESDLSSTGVTGAWEAFCSGRGIPRYVRHRLETDDEWAAEDTEFTQSVANGDSLSAPMVFTAAAEGDPFARGCLQRVLSPRAFTWDFFLNWEDYPAFGVGETVLSFSAFAGTKRCFESSRMASIILETSSFP